MRPSFNLGTIVSLLGAVQALLLALALVTVRRGDRTANRLLAAFFAAIAVLLGGSILASTHYMEWYPHLSRINHPFDFLPAPLLYLYLRRVVRGSKFEKKDLLHFAPFALCIVYLIPYYLQSSEEKLSNLSSPPYARWYFIRTALALSLGLVYMIFIILMVAGRSRAAGSGVDSPAAKAALFQARALVTSFLIVLVIAVLRYLFDLNYPQYTRYTNYILPFLATLIVYEMAYFSLRKPEVVGGAQGGESGGVSVESSSPAKKYERSTLTPERAERHLKRLLEVMEREKPYTDGELTVQKLAESLSIPAQHLSQLINERLNQSFTEFINTYRVEEAKRRLLDARKRHYSILAIAEEVGFNSKSAFNAVFKRHANMTPSEFRKISVGDGQE
jgi:AraC-like DNA-binding protein